jgi:hypothetical protein
VSYRFTRRDNSELRHAIQHPQLTVFEMLARSKILDLCDDFLGQLIRRDDSRLRDPGDTTDEVRPIGRSRVSDRRHDTPTGHNDAMLHLRYSNLGK